MNHSEKAEYHEETDKFIRDNQVRELLQNALTELVLKQPEEPLDYLIKYFGTKKHSQLYSVVGFPENIRKSMVWNLLENFRYEQFQRLALEDNSDINMTLNDLADLQDRGVSVILDNFPSTKVQLRIIAEPA